MMTPTKLPDREPHCVILATVDEDSLRAKSCDSQLKDTIRKVQTCQFMNTQDSAWSILDTILSVNPTELKYIQDELDRICNTLLTQSASKPNRSFFSEFFSLFGFKLGRRVSALTLQIFNSFFSPADSSSIVNGLTFYI